MKRTAEQNKFIFRRVMVLLVCILAALISVCAAADAAAGEEPLQNSIDWGTLYSYGDAELENTRVLVQNMGGRNVLVLPSTVSPEKVVLYWNEGPTGMTAIGAVGTAQVESGKAFDLTALCEGEEYVLSLQELGEEEAPSFELTLLFSKHVSAMYLVSQDPVNEGRVWVESSADKSNKAIGSMVMQKADGSLVYNGGLTQIKGRGNSTWKAEKKPYQIKLESKADLLETGNKENKSKTWILLANHYDPALLRNTLMLNLGSALGMNVVIENAYVDLFYDGEYRGCYLLTEKVELGEGRVDITDLEEANETANPEMDIEALPVATATTANGATYTYCAGMTSPEDITGGYLLEMDLGERAVEEVSYFYTKRGEYVVVKSPEYASREEMEYIATLYQEYEDAVYNGGVHPENGKAYTEYVDLESTVQYYLINEFSKNRDVFHSSAYLCKEAGKDIMTMGPLWDYDLCLGKGGGDLTDNVLPEGILAAKSGLGAALMKLDDFRETAKAQYANEFYPLVKDVILGEADAVSETGTLHALSYYTNRIAAAAQCNALLWNTEDWLTSVDALKEFIACRAEWLNEFFAQLSAESDLTSTKYIDVFEDDWYYEGVQKAAKYGLMFGIGGDTFDPSSGVQRGHVAQILYRMAGEPLSAFEPKFSDVSPTDWQGNGITWAANMKLIGGYPDGTFRPAGVITREDLAVILYRHQGMPEVDASILAAFPDEGEISSYARKAVAWAVQEGLINGYEDGSIRPQGVIKRAELAVLLVRVYEMVYAPTEGR